MSSYDKPINFIKNLKHAIELTKFTINKITKSIIAIANSRLIVFLNFKGL